jgi:hypothetical protein
MITWLALHYKREDDVVIFAMVFDIILNLAIISIAGSIFL